VKGLIENEDPNISTIYQLFMKNMGEFAQRRCLGTKVMIQPGTEEESPVYEYKWKSFEKVHQECQILASAIKSRELYSEVNDPDFNVSLRVLGICSVNREEWIMTDLASNLLKITSVPLYETLG